MNKKSILVLSFVALTGCANMQATIPESGASQPANSLVLSAQDQKVLRNKLIDFASRLAGWAATR